MIVEYHTFDNDDAQEEENTMLQLDMGRTIVRDKDVVMDLIRSTLPSLLFIEFITAAINASLEHLFGSGGGDGDGIYLATLSFNAIFDMTALMTTNDSMNNGIDLLLNIITSVLAIFLGYTAVVLPMVRIILTERDDQLARGVSAACYIAAEKASRDEEENQGGGRVVAVLGLLHLNGVAKRLIDTFE